MLAKKYREKEERKGEERKGVENGKQEGKQTCSSPGERHLNTEQSNRLMAT